MLGRMGHWDEAADYARKELELEPTVDRAVELGSALDRAGFPGEAASLLRQALVSNPASGDLKERLGSVLIRLRQPDEARSHCVVEWHPKIRHVRLRNRR